MFIFILITKTMKDRLIRTESEALHAIRR